MTLFKQITAILSVFIVMVLVVIMWLNFKSATDFVQNQLYTSSQDAANALALSLSNADDIEDLSAIKTIINAAFDSGYYQEITFYDIEENIISKNENIVKVKNVPDWFISAINIDIPYSESLVSKGWMPMGTLKIKSHSGHAYLRLWDTMIDILYGFLIISVFTLSGIFILLKIILKSLDRVQEQALSISNNSFIIQEKIPFTTEFKQLVLSMNKMVKKVESIFQQSSQSVRKYHQLLYYDDLTGLGNRKFFILNLENYLTSSDKQSSGMVLLISLQNIMQLKNIMGYKKIEELLIHFTDIIKKQTKDVQGSLCAKIGQADYTVILPSISKAAVQKITSGIINDVKETIEPIKEQAEAGANFHDFSINIAGVNYKPDDTTGTVLSRADYALTNAQNKGEYRIELFIDEGTGSFAARGKVEWRQEIVNSMTDNRIKVASQPVMMIDRKDNVYHHEMLLRMEDSDGNLLNAGFFIPQASKLGIINDVDKHVFELIFNYILSSRFDKPVVINLSADFIKDNQMALWLKDKLQSLTKQTDIAIIFEINNLSILQNINIIKEFTDFLNKLGLFVGIDQFTADSKDLDYLKNLKPAYLKISQSYLKELMHPETGHGAGEALNIVASAYDIKIIGTHIESKEQKDSLAQLGVKYFQGNYIKEATLIDEWQV